MLTKRVNMRVVRVLFLTYKGLLLAKAGLALGRNNPVSYPEYVVITRKRQFAVGHHFYERGDLGSRVSLLVHYWSTAISTTMVISHVLVFVFLCLCFCVFVLYFGAVGVHGLVDHHDAAPESMVNVILCLFFGGFWCLCSRVFVYVF